MRELVPIYPYCISIQADRLVYYIITISDDTYILWPRAASCTVTTWTKWPPSSHVLVSTARNIGQPAYNNSRIAPHII